MKRKSGRAASLQALQQAKTTLYDYEPQTRFRHGDPVRIPYEGKGKVVREQVSPTTGAVSVWVLMDAGLRRAFRPERIRKTGVKKG